MLAQRAAQHSLRRLAAAQPSMLSQMAFKNSFAPRAIVSSIQTRPVATQKMTPEDSMQILIAQRKNRPTSPHLAIYRPQITWYNSIAHRITGASLSGAFYIFGSAYLVAPLFGWHLDSASMAAAFATWPVLLKVLAKFTFALPFTFHSFNGMRHLFWDMGQQLKNAQVNRTGWITVWVSLASALGLALFM